MKKIFLLLLLLSTANVLFAINQKEKEGDDKISAPRARFDHFYKLRAYPFDEIPLDARHKSFAEKDRMIHNQLKKQSFIQAQQPAWKCIGPYEIGGRVRSIVIHPTNPDIVYIGAAAGGVWKTTDGGENWKPTFDFQNSLSFGALAIDENNPETIYAASGEFNGSLSILGSGIYKTTDGGDTWALIGLTDVGSFSKIYVHPKNSNLIVAGGANRGAGFYVSKDAGKSWTRKNTDQISDITINPNNENEYMTGVYGIGMQYTSNMGDSWETRTNGLSIASIGRTSVQWNPSNPNSCYALLDTPPPTGTTGANIAYICKSDNKGGSWTVLKQGPDIFGDNSQGWYDNYISINPANPAQVYAGGIDLWKSENGFSFGNITNVYGGGSTHPDQHCMAFSKSNSKIIWFGNDGGVYRSTDGGVNFEKKSMGLAITQFYAMAVDPSNKNRNYGGTQDNGTPANRIPDFWQSILGGDGFQTIVDPFDNNIVIAESQYGNMFRIDFSSGQPIYSSMTAGKGLPPNNSTYAPFFAPIAADPLNREFYFHGRYGVWFSSDRGNSSWFQVLKNRPAFCTSIACASDPKVSDLGKIVVFAGFANGELWVTEDENLEKWEQVNLNGLPNRAISNIVTSKQDYKTAYVTVSGFGTPHVYKTTDLGKTWISLSDNLPNAPFNAIAINPENPANLFAASDIGVFSSFDDGATWTPFGNGLPNSPVVDLQFHTNRSVLEKLTLRAATHGRSIWEIEIPNEAITESAITSPIGGEIYAGATNQRISWYGFGNSVDVAVSINDGETWQDVAQDVVGNNMLMMMPNRSTFKARIKITSKSNPNNFKISNSFTLKQKNKGTVLLENGVSFIPYGIAYDGTDYLWATDVSSPSAGTPVYMYKLNSQTLQVVDKIKVQDSIYTDLAIDKATGDFYVHRFLSLAEGSSGLLDRIDKTGKRLSSITSPAGLYPIGIALADNKLFITNRDGSSKKITVIDAKTFSKISEFPNPCSVNFGPRGLAYDESDYFYQVCTFFPAGGALSDASVYRINKSDFSLESKILLENSQGLINARGVDYDPRDKNFWVSDYGGNIYKVAGFSTVLSVEEQFDLSNNLIDLNIYPNPMYENGSVSFELKNKSGIVSIELYSNTGNKIGTLFEQFSEMNNPKVIEINNDKLSSGVYNLVIKLDGEPLFTKNLTVIK